MLTKSTKRKGLCKEQRKGALQEDDRAESGGLDGTGWTDGGDKLGLSDNRQLRVALAPCYHHHHDLSNLSNPNPDDSCVILSLAVSCRVPKNVVSGWVLGQYVRVTLASPHNADKIYQT